MLRHVDDAIETASADGNVTVAVKLQASKGSFWDDEAFLVDALARAEVSGDAATRGFVEHRYSAFLGAHGQFEKSLAHVSRAVDLLGGEGERLQQAIVSSTESIRVEYEASPTFSP